MPESILLALLQVEPSAATSSSLRLSIIVGVCMAVIVVLMVYTFKSLRPKADSSSTTQIRDEFDKQKEALLLAAQAKKASREAEESARREGDKDEKERELLREQVDPEAAIGRSCPLCGMEIMHDSDIIIDPYSGTAYHFSAFLHDWPADTERPKFVFRWPADKMLRSEDLIRGF